LALKAYTEAGRANAFLSRRFINSLLLDELWVPSYHSRLRFTEINAGDGFKAALMSHQNIEKVLRTTRRNILHDDHIAAFCLQIFSLFGLSAFIFGEGFWLWEFLRLWKMYPDFSGSSWAPKPVKWRGNELKVIAITTNRDS
jgi:hypothetical protein